MTFTWDLVSNDCEPIAYLINASNCGNCTTPIYETLVTCTEIHPNGELCEFAVHTLLCNFIGTKSLTLNVILKGNYSFFVPSVTINFILTILIFYAVPNVTTLHVVPVYFQNYGEPSASFLHMIISTFYTTVKLATLHY